MSSQVGSTYGTWFEFEATGKRIYSGTGSPEGVQDGSVGDLYLRADPSVTAPPIYFKASGTATTTGWVALVATVVTNVRPGWVGGEGTLAMVGNRQPDLVVA